MPTFSSTTLYALTKHSSNDSTHHEPYSLFTAHCSHCHHQRRTTGPSKLSSGSDAPTTPTTRSATSIITRTSPRFWLTPSAVGRPLSCACSHLSLCSHHISQLFAMHRQSPRRLAGCPCRQKYADEVRRTMLRCAIRCGRTYIYTTYYERTTDPIRVFLTTSPSSARSFVYSLYYLELRTMNEPYSLSCVLALHLVGGLQ